VIELVIAAVAVAATATGAAIWAARRARRAARSPVPARARSVDRGELQPGDVVVHLGSDYLVEGVAILREGGRDVLVIARMCDGPVERFLVVDPASRQPCAVCERNDQTSTGHAVPKMLVHDGAELRLSARAAVRLFALGSFGFPKEAACELGLYAGPGQRVAVVMIVEGVGLVVAGRVAAEAGFELLPGK